MLHMGWRNVVSGRGRLAAVMAALGLGLAPAVGAEAVASAAGLAGAMRFEAFREAGAPQEAPDLRALFERLDLTSEQREAVDEVFSRHLEGDREPLAALRAAVAVREILSEEQTRSLLEAGRETLRERGPRAGPGRRGGHGRPGGPLAGPGRRFDGPFAELDLTDEQREAIREIRESHGEELEALREARRSGEAPEGVREKARSLFEAMHEEMEAVLTEEQRARLAELHEARREHRADARERMRERRGDRAEMAEERAEILGLTAEQIEALRAPRDEGRRGGPGRRGARHEAMAEILTPEQRDAVAIARLFARGLRARS